MTIVDTGGGAAVQMSNTYASWIKGVRFISTNANPINVSNSLYGLISNNYIFPNTALNGNFSPSILFQTSTATMILNNITISSTEAYEGYGLNVGNVGAFNFSRDSTSSQTFNILYDHHPFSSFDLFEGNQVAAGYEDDTWGTHALNTYFRNFMPCSDTPYLFGSLGQGNPLGMAVDSFQRFDNYVGNALGTLSECPTYQSANAGAIWRVNAAGNDPMVTPSMLRWGNVSVVQQGTDTPTNSGIRFVSSEVPSSINPNTSCTGTNVPLIGCTGSGTGTINASAWDNPVPGTTNLPCSFFLGGETDIHDLHSAP